MRVVFFGILSIVLAFFTWINYLVIPIVSLILALIGLIILISLPKEKKKNQLFYLFNFALIAVALARSLALVGYYMPYQVSIY